MASETRRLVFSREELISATLDYCRHDGIAVPDAEIEQIELGPGAQPTLVLFFHVGQPMDLDRVALSADQLAAALARFCKRNDIPLPLHPEKKLRCEDGYLTMLCRIDHRSRCKMAAVPG